MAEQDQNAAPAQENNPVVHTKKIYIKDISFETPNSPAVFTREWKPKVKLDLGEQLNELAHDHFEVVLSLTVTVTVGDQTAYLAEVQQAGIFHLQGIDDTRLRNVLHVYCPRQLFPYAAFVISDLVTRGGFPQLLLSPVNFDALYRKRLAEAGDAAQPAVDEGLRE